MFGYKYQNNYGHWLSGPVVEAFAHPKPSVKDQYNIMLLLN